MTMERAAWADAFARQARSDFDVYELLATQPTDKYPCCHSLHYLQMACEKLAKAYRIRETGAQLHGESGLLRRHVGFEKFVSSYLLSPRLKEQYQGKSAQLREVRKRVVALARQIERLAPAVDGAVAPENAEYPWASGDGVVAPRDYDFPRLALLRETGGRTLLKLVKQALREV